jgi:murein peptide amidase A
MRRALFLAVAVGSILVLVAGFPGAANSKSQHARLVGDTGPRVIGRSVRGRAIRAYERGDRTAPVTLIVGVIHGTETAGLRVVRRLRRVRLPAHVHLWLVPTENPDGMAAGTRQNAHGVDLNRNWPASWRRKGHPWSGEYSGPRPLSEPENRVMRRFIRRVKPALTIWYHQPLDLVYGSDPHVKVLRRYARLAGLPYRPLHVPHGAATLWERIHFHRGAHFVVEFPAGPPSARAVRRNASAALALAPRKPTI